MNGRKHLRVVVVRPDPAVVFRSIFLDHKAWQYEPNGFVDMFVCNGRRRIVFKDGEKRWFDEEGKATGEVQ